MVSSFAPRQARGYGRILIVAAAQAAPMGLPSQATMAQQFQVPQFIDYQARLLGPFTIRQSAILGLAGVIIFVLYFMLEKFLFYPVAFLVATAAVLFSFIQINGRPLSSFFTSFFSFFVSPQLYIWQKEERKIGEKEKFIKKAREEKSDIEELKKEQITRFIKTLKQ